uniref:Uncharacterized protein n=1 Tax=Rangifer tarandus platyrhynchus TaxID=3082113 RepID=A0ACB0F4G4_RANTA|nr:unnamed protein product [Rangifer tarandus platyrhynchus]
MHLCLGRRIGRGNPRPRPAFRSCLAPSPEARRPRKRVVFADTKGLSLTSVHSFEDAVGADSEKDSCGGSRGARPAPPSSPKPRPSVPSRPAPGRTPGSAEASADPTEARSSARGRRPPARRREGSRTRFPEGRHAPGAPTALNRSLQQLARPGQQSSPSSWQLRSSWARPHGASDPAARLSTSRTAPSVPRLLGPPLGARSAWLPAPRPSEPRLPTSPAHHSAPSLLISRRPAPYRPAPLGHAQPGRARAGAWVRGVRLDGGGRGWGWDARVTSRRRRQRAGARTSLRTPGAGGGGGGSGKGGTDGPRRDLAPRASCLVSRARPPLPEGHGPLAGMGVWAGGREGPVGGPPSPCAAPASGGTTAAAGVGGSGRWSGPPVLAAPSVRGRARAPASPRPRAPGV